MARKKKGPQIPKNNTAKYSNHQVLKSDKRSASDRRRAHAARLVIRRSGCYNPDVRRGLGAVIFVLGFPMAIAGIVMTVVDATDNAAGSKYPAAFAHVGPILISFALIFIIVGFIMSSVVVSKAVVRFFSFDDPDSFCRVHCPRLSHCIRPDDIIIMNQHAMNALKSEPGKSALKRKRPEENFSPKESDQLTQQPQNETISGEAMEPPLATGDNVDVVSELKLGFRRGIKGVRFSESDLDHLREARDTSLNSSDNGSVLSLRNCKVYPKIGIWHTKTLEEMPSEQASKEYTQPSTSSQHYTTEL